MVGIGFATLATWIPFLMHFGPGAIGALLPALGYGGLPLGILCGLGVSAMSVARRRVGSTGQWLDPMVVVVAATSVYRGLGLGPLWIFVDRGFLTALVLVVPAVAAIALVYHWTPGASAADIAAGVVAWTGIALALVVAGRVVLWLYWDGAWFLQDVGLVAAIDVVVISVGFITTRGWWALPVTPAESRTG